MLRKAFCFFLSVMLSGVMLCVTAFAKDARTGAVHGVRTAEELMAISGSGSYALYEDIDLSGIEWTGIKSFSGKLYGNGHEIKDLRSESSGLFRSLGSGAEITDLRLENCEIVTKTKYLGGIVSCIPQNAKNVRITNCAVSGLVETRFGDESSKLNYCGAVAGLVKSRSAVISGCSGSAYVIGGMGVGGIAGLNYGKIENSAFTGRIGNYGNDHVHCDCPVDEGAVEQDHTAEYCLSWTQGGICAVNCGTLNNCVSLVSTIGDAERTGMICGINLIGKGVLRDCISLHSIGSTEGEYYDDICNEFDSLF